MDSLRKLLSYAAIARWLVIPVLTSLLVIIEATQQNKKLNEAGTLVSKIETEYHLRAITYISVGIILGILLLVATSNINELAGIYVFIIFIPILAHDYKNYRYSRINGIYENGIILNSFYRWKDIHSWKNVENNTISILDSNGIRFDIPYDNGRIKHLQNKMIREDK